jgi:lipopolysaccharide export system protein LptA
LIAAALAAGLALAAPTAAAHEARKAPVRVDADEVHYAFQRGQVTFTGKPVTLTRDDAKLECKRLVAHTDASGRIVSAACEGDVRFARRARVVTCERATFDDAQERVVCEGRPVLRDGGSEAHGTRLVYDLRSDEARLEGAQVTVPGEEIDERQKALEARRKEARR